MEKPASLPLAAARTRLEKIEMYLKQRATRRFRDAETLAALAQPRRKQDRVLRDYTKMKLAHRRVGRPKDAPPPPSIPKRVFDPTFSPRRKHQEEMNEPRPARYEPAVFEKDELKPLATAVLRSALADLNEESETVRDTAKQFLLVDFWDDECLWLEILGNLPKEQMLREIHRRLRHRNHGTIPRKYREDDPDEHEGAGEEVLGEAGGE